MSWFWCNCESVILTGALVVFMCEHSVHVEQAAFTGCVRTVKWLFSSFVFRRCLSEGSRLTVALWAQPPGLLPHVHDCNEQKVGLADNCRPTRATARINHFSGSCLHLFVSVLSPPLPSSVPLFFFLFITLQLQLIGSGKLGPSTSLSPWLGRTRVSWVTRQREQEVRKRETEEEREGESGNFLSEKRQKRIKQNVFPFNFHAVMKCLNDRGCVRVEMWETIEPSPDTHGVTSVLQTYGT